MAVIENVLASLVSFAVNNTSTRLLNNVGTYGTSEILNGGEVIDNQLSYTFRVTGLNEHTIKSITIYSLLLTDTGDLCPARRLTMGITDYGSSYTGNFLANDLSKTILPQTFNQNVAVDGDFTFILNVSTNATASCYYGLHSIAIDLQDIPYSVKLTFSGPTSNRSSSNITTSTLIVNLGAVEVSFSKDPAMPFNPQNDNVEGRMYLRQDGIYVDGYQYGVVAPATDLKLGLVKLFHTFATDEDGGIIAPDVSNAAATPQLVYNTIATLKNYTDEQVAGILAPNAYIEEEVTVIDEDTQEARSEIQDRQLLDKITFSDEFESIGEDNRIHLKWLEII